VFRFRQLIPLSVLPFLLACPDPKPPQRVAGSPQTGNPVYDQPDARPAGEGIAQERVLNDPESYFSEDVGTDDLTEEISPPKTDLPNLNWEPIYFLFDDATLTQEAKDRLGRYADQLKAHPGLQVLLEGHCDERGTEDYNLALGERRAQNVKRFLIESGVRESMMDTVSYGELSPLDLRHDESGWSRNRRVAFTF